MRVGIDIGGSHVGVGLISSNGEVIKVQERYLRDRKIDSEEKYILEEIISILKNWKDTENIEFSEVGIGAPGIIHGNEIVKSINLNMHNFKIGEEIKKIFPMINVKVMNDAKCAALAEKRWGSLKDYDDCVFLCLGTGIGGATFFNGKLVKPKRCAGFEVGHMIIEKDGVPCKCGSKGCFEQYASMKHFKKIIRERLRIDESVDGGALRDLIRQNIDLDIVKDTIDEFISYLCTGLTNIVNILEPQAICLGGGFVKYEDIIFNKLKEAFENSKEIFYKENIPKLIMAKYGNDAGMIGSTLLFEE